MQFENYVLLNRNLYQRNPFLGVFLIPGAIDIAGSMLSSHLEALFLHVSEGFGEGLIEAVIRAYVLHAQRLGDGRLTS